MQLQQLQAYWQELCDFQSPYWGSGGALRAPGGQESGVESTGCARSKTDSNQVVVRVQEAFCQSRGCPATLA